MRNNLKNDKKNEKNSNVGKQKKYDKNTAPKITNSKLTLGSADYLKKKVEETHKKNHNPKKIRITLYPNPEETKNNYSYFKSNSGVINQIKINKSFTTNPRLSSIKASQNLSFTTDKKTNKIDDYINEFRTGSYAEENKGFQKPYYKVMKTNIDEIKTARKDRKYSFQVSSEKRELFMKDSRFKRKNSHNDELKELAKISDKTYKIKRYESSTINNRRKPNKKIIEEEEDDDWNIEQFNGYRKTTLDVGQRGLFKNKLASEFSKIEFVKSSKAISVAGRGENGLKKLIKTHIFVKEM